MTKCTQKDDSCLFEYTCIQERTVCIKKITPYAHQQDLDTVLIYIPRSMNLHMLSRYDFGASSQHGYSASQINEIPGEVKFPRRASYRTLLRVSQHIQSRDLNAHVFCHRNWSSLSAAIRLEFRGSHHRFTQPRSRTQLLKIHTAFVIWKVSSVLRALPSAPRWY